MQRCKKSNDISVMQSNGEKKGVNSCVEMKKHRGMASIDILRTVGVWGVETKRTQTF